MFLCKRRRNNKLSKKRLQEKCDRLENELNSYKKPLLKPDKDITPSMIKDFKNMHKLTDKKFEKFMKSILESAGFHTEGTDEYDNGVDLVASKDKITYFIQIKGRNNQGNVLDKNYFIKEEDVSKYPHKLNNCSQKVFITNTYFTKNAIRLLNDNNFEMIDLEKLYKLIAQLAPELIAMAYMSVDGLEKCPNCNKHKCLCHSYGGEFYGCSNYPNCEYHDNSIKGYSIEW